MAEGRNYRSIDIKILDDCLIEKRENGFWKSLFGRRFSLFYKPTGAIVAKKTRTYPVRCYDNISKLVTLGAYKRCENMDYDPNGNVMLTCYISEDKEYIMMQASRCLDFEYIPTTDTFTYTNDEAQSIISNMCEGGII